MRPDSKGGFCIVRVRARHVDVASAIHDFPEGLKLGLIPTIAAAMGLISMSKKTLSEEPCYDMGMQDCRVLGQ